MAIGTNWSEMIGQSFINRGDSDFTDALKYTVISVESDNRVVFERDDSWTLTAVNPVIDGNGRVDWDYSLNGRFTDEQRVQKYVEVSKHLHNGKTTATTETKQDIDESEYNFIKSLNELFSCYKSMSTDEL